MTSRESVENKGSKRRNNYALECGPEWNSWICNNWTAGVTAVASLVPRPFPSLYANEARL